MVESIKDYLKTPNWRNQLKWRRMIWTAMVRAGLTGAYALPLNKRWVEIHRRKMTLRNLDPALVGLRLVQISDLHYSPVVWQKYLIQYLNWVNDLEPDIVVVTGDLITGGYRYAHRIATILSHLKAPLGVICTFGNHDYSIYGKSHQRESNRRGDYLEKCLEDRGLIVLRNEVHEVWRPQAKRPLVLVGLDDEWSRHIDPEKAFANVSPDDAVVCLNHNPVNALELMKYPWQWMLAGHTHGRQVATSRFGQTFYAKRYRHYTHGHYAVRGRHLYVNRGLSYGQRVLEWCRPEITAFRLAQPAAVDGTGAESVNGQVQAAEG